MKTSLEKKASLPIVSGKSGSVLRKTLLNPEVSVPSCKVGFKVSKDLRNVCNQIKPRSRFGCNIAEQLAQ